MHLFDMRQTAAPFRLVWAESWSCPQQGQDLGWHWTQVWEASPYPECYLPHLWITWIPLSFLYILLQRLFDSCAALAGALVTASGTSINWTAAALCRIKPINFFREFLVLTQKQFVNDNNPCLVSMDTTALKKTEIVSFIYWFMSC